MQNEIATLSGIFLLTPLREGRPPRPHWLRAQDDFYSRPCGRGDSKASSTSLYHELFLLTPLREGRLVIATPNAAVLATISTHAPAGGATVLVLMHAFESP